jgi:hypothetical protein
VTGADRDAKSLHDVREPWALRYTGALVISGIVATVTIAVVGVFVAPHSDLFVVQSLTGVNRSNAQDQVRNVWLKMAAGVGAAFAAFVTWGRLELARRGQVTDRYSNAVGQLGSDDPAVRLGGLYALNRIARDSPEDRPTVFRVICAFIRFRTSPGFLSRAGDSEPYEDVRAALNIAAKRLTAQHVWDNDEAPVDLTNAVVRGEVLSGAHLGHALLERVNLFGADLSDGDFHRAILRNADLRHAKLEHCDLSWADLREAELGEAKLEKANLSHADLRGTDLSHALLNECQLKDAVWGNTDLTGADLTDVLNLTVRLQDVRTDGQTRWPAGFSAT